MVERYIPLLTRSFLNSIWAAEYATFKDSKKESELVDKLDRWARRKVQKETSAESGFEQRFFQEIWGYTQSGEDKLSPDQFTHYPKFSIAGGSAKGGMGEADSALGKFGRDQVEIPQVVCEYKDIKSGLDLPQRRGADRRSPVRQALDYLTAAKRNLPPFAPIQPAWAIVTDMDEFRLYWSDRGDREFMRFKISADLFDGETLLSETDDARFDRFVFQKIFSPKMLLVQGASGKSALANLIDKQWIHEKKLEKAFYKEYRAYRENLCDALIENNGEDTDRFPGTKGRLVRLAQKILDRFIFVFFCEDMGTRIGYPPQLLRDYLIKEAGSEYFDPKGFDVWDKLKVLFGSMNSGGKFGTFSVSQFNGGLFSDDPTLNALRVPNRVFCAPGQGINEASLAQYKNTLLYLSARYNYATGFGNQPDEAAQEATELGLYTLGRIFEQSITELEVLEAEADGKPSLNKITKRKRDGVYYTPEWVVERIVEDTLGRRLEEIKTECGWPLSVDTTARGKKLRLKSISEYEERLSDIKIVDPACGSGAFLITALRRLTKEWSDLRYLRSADEGGEYTAPGDVTINRILTTNIYGVDINASSVEIAKLALWLHTANGQSPLSSLDETIKEGNSLIGPEFFNSLAEPTAEERERINPFDWVAAFPEVFDEARPNGSGFDVVIGNPPYVKLQNFRTIHADMAAFLQMDRAGNETYASTQTGNFDLYLPFIEKGISLLNQHGRLGYIAPSLWIMNDYGEGLRKHVTSGKHLEGWIDFGSYQIFDDVSVYTALQYYTKSSNKKVATGRAYDGTIEVNPFEDKSSVLSYKKLVFRDRWLMATGNDRSTMDKMLEASTPLIDVVGKTKIFQGVKTGADPIYKLVKKEGNKYYSKSSDEEFEIEKGILQPIISSDEVKKFAEIETNIFALFPYENDNSGSLIGFKELASKYPKATKYLTSHIKSLKKRDGGKINLDQWYGYSRTQSLNKLGIPKITVPCTVKRLRASLDPNGDFLLTGARVEGIIVTDKKQANFLTAMLNSKAVNFFFKNIGRPKSGGFFEANKQFIAPLPIPEASKSEVKSTSELAKALKKLHTNRRELIQGIGNRLTSVPSKKLPANFIFPELPIATKEALSEGETITTLKADRKLALDARYNDLTERLTPDVELSARLKKGELQFLIDSVPSIAGIFPDENEAEFLLAQWNYIASTFNVTPRTTGKALAMMLQTLAVTNDKARRSQVVKMQRELRVLENEIEQAETKLDNIVYKLYGLSKAQIAHIENVT